MQANRQTINDENATPWWG